MKRLRTIIVSVLTVISPVVVIITAVAGEPSNGVYTDNYYNPFNALVVNARSVSASENSQKSATKTDYTPVVAHIGKPLAFVISATDPDNNPLIYTASNLPPGATFDPLTGAFSWTPGYDQAGIYPNIHFVVSDGELTDSEDITITVLNFNRPPILDSIGNKSATEQKPLGFTITATDPDNDSLIYSASGLPTGATFSPQTRAFSWTPGAGQQGTYAAIHFQVSDGTLTDSEDITITVAAGGGDLIPPVISGIAVTGVTTNSAIITWLTNEPSNSRVDYWVTSNLTTVLGANLVTNHTVNLSNLSPNTTYSYKVISADAAGNTAEQSGGTFTTSRAASFSVSSLSINPDKTSAGKKVSIRVIATNKGSVSGTYTLTLKINGTIEATRAVTISPSASVTVTFTTQKDVAGVYTVDVNGLTDSFTVAAGRSRW